MRLTMKVVEEKGRMEGLKSTTGLESWMSAVNNMMKVVVMMSVQSCCYPFSV